MAMNDADARTASEDRFIEKFVDHLAGLIYGPADDVDFGSASLFFCLGGYGNVVAF